MAQKEPHHDRIKKEIIKHLLTKNDAIAEFLRSKIKEHQQYIDEYQEALNTYERRIQEENERDTEQQEKSPKGKPPIPKIIT